MSGSTTHETKELLILLARTILLGMFMLMAGFWLIVAIYVIYGFFRGGAHEVSLWLLHVGLRPWESLRGLNRRTQWDLVALRFGAVAVVTVLLWLANRRTIRHAIARWRHNAATP
jgi:hypothetical protein